MRKYLFILFIILAGCSNQNIEATVIKEHHGYSIDDSVRRAPVHWEVRLKNELTEESYPILMNDYGFFHYWDYDQEALEGLARELASQLNTTMLPVKKEKDGTFTSGRPEVTLEEEELVKKLMTLEVGVQEVILPLDVKEPNVKATDLEKIEEKVVGEYRTYFNPNVEGRSKNIVLSAEAISGIVLGQGDSFSFNDVVGERTAERGYKEALEIVNKEFVLGIGGGICQTSTTLFNAVDQVGVEIIERYTHSRDVGYVERGRDATVSWNGPDFRFVNPHPFPILIRASVNLEAGELRLIVYSQK